MAKTKVSRLAQIYRSERSQGRGLSSAIGKATLEKIDPRQFFNQQGLLASIFPSLFKAYKAPSQSDKTTAPTALNFSTASLESKIENLSMHAKISARNSLVLPSMARDMNLTRQNIAKLVKLQGGKPTYKSDMFFMRAAEREAAYESQFRRTATSSLFPSTTPTPSKEPSGSGILSSLFKVVSTIGATIASAITPLISVIKSILGPLLSLAKTGISLVLSAGGKAIGAVAGGLASILRSAIPFLLNPAVLATLGVGGIAALIAYLIKNDAMSGKEGEETVAGANQSAQEPGTITMSPEEQAVVPSTTSPGLGAILDKAEKAKRVGPNGERLVIQNGVQGYMKKGMGRSGGLQFVPLPASTTPTMADFQKTDKDTTPVPVPGVTTDSRGRFKTKQEFLAGMYPLAVRASEKLGGVDPNALLSQWGLESAWGSRLAGKFNYFGIKADASWNGPKEFQSSAEFKNGQMKNEVSAFRSYSSAEEAVDDYVNFLKVNPRYEKAGLFKAKTSDEWFTALKTAGYATDPNYVNKLTNMTGETSKQTSSLSSATSLASSASLMPSVPTSGPLIAAATTDVAQVRSQASSAPIIVSPPTVNVQAPQSQAMVNSLGSPTSVIDVEFMKLLVGRTVTL